MPDGKGQTLAEALLQVQKKLDPVPKRGKNPHFNSAFVTLDDLLNAVVPVLNDHGIALVQMPTHIDNVPALKTELRGYGEIIHATMPLVLEKNDMQKLGGAITYGRRYMLTAMLGIAESTDDDGNQASRPPDRRVDPETPVPKSAAEVEALWVANDLDSVWLEQARAVKPRPSVQKMATVVVRLLAKEPGEPFGYSREQIQQEFAAVLDGVILEGPPAVSQEELDRMTAKVLGRVEGEEDDIVFGDPA